VTQAVRAVRIDIPGWKEKLVLVDTPGFDDTNRSNVDVLTMIAEWLNETYGN
jgi:GTPase Era involved in 16S rRNA processing